MISKLTSDVILILSTDIWWTVVVVVGIYYGQNEVKESRKVYAWASVQRSRHRTSKMARLNKRAAWALLIAMILGTLVGVGATSSDLIDLLSRGRELELEPVRFTYRILLITLMMGVVYALRILKQMRDLWKE